MIFAKKARFLFIVCNFLLITCLSTNNIYPRHRHKRHGRNHRHNVQQFTPMSTVPTLSNYANFARTKTKIVNQGDSNFSNNTYVWQDSSDQPFDEAIFSWNSLRPSIGKMSIWVSVKLANSWSDWNLLADWGSRTQKSYSYKHNPYVHTKHVRVELQKGCRANAFRMKVKFEGGAEKENLRALYACTSNLHSFKIGKPDLSMPSIIVKGVPKLSQMVLHHPRYRELCSPTSTSILVNYFYNKLYGTFANSNLNSYATNFAEKAHDRGPLNIYGNWLFNVAQAYDSCNGSVLYHVERLNGFNELYGYISRGIPVVVSVRRLRGGATPYRNGHLMVVVGWNQEKRTVVCVDPAYEPSTKTIRAYKIWNFLQAWGLSYNLSYIAKPIREIV